MHYEFDAFYSDPHFGHHNILAFTRRPYSSVKEMRDEFIALYNSVVEPTHTVLWLGDCFFYEASDFAKILKAMNGVKVLVRGNHDRMTFTKYRQLGFDFVARELLIEIEGVSVRCNHYPYQRPGEVLTPKQMKRRPPRVPGEVLLHGHTHNPRRHYKNMIHVGVDAWGYRPATKQEIIRLFSEVESNS